MRSRGSGEIVDAFCKLTGLLSLFFFSLNTIADYDKIVYMEAGQVREVGSPAELVNKPGGFFKSLVDETGDTNAEAIRAIALGLTKGGLTVSGADAKPPISILKNSRQNLNVEELKKGEEEYVK